ncbi:MAG: hypothetical protein WC449_05595 [Candidatus Paceibacterota bacterium]
MVAAVGVAAAAASAAGSMASASAQSDANSKAGAANAAATAQARQDVGKARNKAVGYMDPYSKVGRSALDELSQQMGLGGSYGQSDVPTNAKIGKESDPAWAAIIQKYNPSGKSWSSKKMQEVYKQASAEYLATKNQQGQGGESTNPNAGYLTEKFGAEQYKNDPGYTPMVNSLEELQNTPGYKFQLEQGLQSVNNSAAARGGLLSGGQLKAVNNYAQGQASTGYQAAWERAQNAYNAAFQRDTTNKNNTFNRLQSMSNNGQQAAQTQGNYQMDAGKSLAGVAQQGGENAASLALAQGQNQANMYTGIGNAVNQGLGAFAGGMGGVGADTFNGGGTAMQNAALTNNLLANAGTQRNYGAAF